MGTSTFYLRYNDFGRRLSSLTKKELKIFDEFSPYKKENSGFGWRVPLELHNGNINILVWWRGKLMRLEDAPEQLDNKYYNKYTGKTLREYEWTILKKMILREVEYLDKSFKKEISKKSKK